MVLKLTVIMAALCVAIGAAADVSSVPVNPPLVCKTEAGMQSVVKYHIVGGPDLSRAWVSEYSEDCFAIHSAAIPTQMVSAFVILAQTESLAYGYIPVTYWGFDFYLFYILIKTPGVPV